jgi:hypothetical protein
MVVVGKQTSEEFPVYLFIQSRLYLSRISERGAIGLFIAFAFTALSVEFMGDVVGILVEFIEVIVGFICFRLGFMKLFDGSIDKYLKFLS